MFEPVSPSGTGKTLRALTSSTAASRPAAAARKAPSRPCAVARPAGHQPRPSCCGGITRRPSRCRPGPTARARRLGRGAAARRPDGARGCATRIVSRSTSRPSAVRIAWRTAWSTCRATSAIGQAVGDAEVQPDRERPARDGDAQAAGPLLDPAEESVRPGAGEAGDAVRAERDAAHDVDHGTARHERPTADRTVRHRPSHPAPRAAPGSARGAWYSTAPFRPDRRERLI